MLLVAGCGNAERSAVPGSPDPQDPRGERRILDTGSEDRADWALTAYREDGSNGVCMSIDVEWRDPAAHVGVIGECVSPGSVPDGGEAELLVEQAGRGNMIVGIAASDVMAVEIAYRGEESGSRTVQTVQLQPWFDGRAFATLLPRLTDVTGVAPTHEP